MKLGQVDLQALLPKSSQEAERSWQDQVEDDMCSLLPSLTIKERVMGCLSCMTLGYILSAGSWFRFRRLLTGDPWPFVFVSTSANIVSLSGACFLSGPRAQARKMFLETRRIATTVYLSSMVVTLVVAFAFTGFKWQAPAMVLLMLFQYAAVTWYCLSYIPFARDAIKKFCIRWWRELLEE